MKAAVRSAEPKRKPSLEMKAPIEGFFRPAEPLIFWGVLCHQLAERLRELLGDWSHFSVPDHSITNLRCTDDLSGGPRKEDLVRVVQIFKTKRPFQDRVLTGRATVSITN